MDQNTIAINMALTQVARKLDQLYHTYAVYCGLSDPAVWVLYTLYERGDRDCTQNDLVFEWSFPKQTINYTVGCLVKNGWARLVQRPGARNGKSIILTDEGRRICDGKILPLMRAEERSINLISDEERELLLRLNELQCSNFEKEIAKLTGETSKNTL